MNVIMYVLTHTYNIYMYIYIIGTPKRNGFCCGRQGLIEAGVDGSLRPGASFPPRLLDKSRSAEHMSTMLKAWVESHDQNRDFDDDGTNADHLQVLKDHGYNRNGLNPLWFHPMHFFADYYLPPDLMHACRNLNKHLFSPCVHNKASNEFKFRTRVINLINLRIQACCLPHDSDGIPDFIKYDGSIGAALQKQALVQFAPVLFVQDFESSEASTLDYYIALCALSWGLSVVLTHGDIDKEQLEKAEMTLYGVFCSFTGTAILVTSL